MAEQHPEVQRKLTRPFIFIFAALVALLGAGYFLFLRTDYTILYSDLRAPEAAAIVAELDRRGVGYRLGAGGSSILVPVAEADGLRVGLAGTDMPTKGDIGFEVFNESSMGLTDFAQKINYQRALQGELARTIMAMEGVESARVHLALPERALFRGTRGEPRAAVTIIPKRGQLLDETRVIGIQRLVVSSVPDLPVANVSVLDAYGRIISPTAAPAATSATPPELEAERSQYLARIRTALINAVPNVPFEVALTLLPMAQTAPLASPEAGGDAFRAFNLRIEIASQAQLGNDDQARMLAALRTAATFDESAGDSISFRVQMASLGATPALVSALPPMPATAIAERNPLLDFLAEHWFALLAVIAILALLVIGRVRSAAAWRVQRADLMQRIRLQLQARETSHGG